MIQGEIDNEVIGVYNEGKKYFPNLSVRNVSTHNDSIEKPRFFINYKKNKGSYTVESFKKHLTYYKIEKTFKWLQQKGKITDYNHSLSTQSIYFKFNGIPVRISDHKSSNTGKFIEVKWDTSPEDILKTAKSNLDI
jgi:hypothetical protein